MSAEVLRRAAALMRERAETATPGPWRDCPMGSEGSTVLAGGNTITTARKPATCREFADATHIASWHPAVALTVADWLDGEAHWFDHGSSSPGSHNAALIVSRAYLGEASDDARCPDVEDGARCELPDGHDGSHRDEHGEWMHDARDSRVPALGRCSARSPMGLPCTRRADHQLDPMGDLCMSSDGRAWTGDPWASAQSNAKLTNDERVTLWGLAAQAGRLTEGTFRAELDAAVESILAARIEQARAEGAAEVNEASKIALTSVYIMAERAARKGYDLDPHEVLQAIREDR